MLRKTFSLLIVGILAIGLAACAEKEVTRSNNKEDIEKENKAHENDDNNSSAERQSEWAVDNSESMKDMDEVDLLIASEKVYLWQEESSDIKWMSYYAVIENDSDTTVDVRNASVTYYDDKSNVLAVSDQGIDFHPCVVEPGEVAVASVYEPAEDIDLSTNVKTELAIEPIPSSGKVHWLDVDGVNGKAKNSGLNVLGKMTNSGDTKAEDIKVAVGVLDENDEFLGTLESGTDVGLAPGKSMGFEAFTPPFPDELAKKASKFEAVAYWIEFDN